MNNYIKYLFDCDYLLWIHIYKEEFEYKILRYENDIKFDKDKFTFTRNIYNWNESNTVKYEGVTIGEFQIHKNRNCFKFRFDINNLINILETKK